MKAQNALEYMSVYIWAIIIISVSAVAFFVILTSTRTPVSYCTFSEGFACPNYYLTSNGFLIFNLVQTTQDPIAVTSIACSANETAANAIKIFNPPSNVITMPSGTNYTFALPCYANMTAFTGPNGATFSGYLLVYYNNTYLHMPNIAYGTVRAQVNTFQYVTAT